MATVAEQFEQFHKDNPHVFELFKKFAYEALRAGFDTFSAYAIRERIRWFTSIETSGTPYKLSNNFTPYYARKLMRECPEFDGFFNLKMMKEAF